MVMVPLVQTWSVRCPDENAFLEQDGETWIRGAGKGIGLFPRDRAVELSINVQWPHGRRTIYVHPEPACACCGKTSYQGTLWRVSRPGDRPAHFRCEQHRDRDPCAIPGCGRTCATTYHRLDDYLCRPHRKLVPPYMMAVMKRLWRIQRKSGGWTEKLIARYWRIWPRCVHFAQNRHAGAGYLDMAEIERDFGL